MDPVQTTKSWTGDFSSFQLAKVLQDLRYSLRSRIFFVLSKTSSTWAPVGFCGLVQGTLSSGDWNGAALGTRLADIWPCSWVERRRKAQSPNCKNPSIYMCVTGSYCIMVTVIVFCWFATVPASNFPKHWINFPIYDYCKLITYNKMHLIYTWIVFFLVRWRQSPWHRGHDQPPEVLCLGHGPWNRPFGYGGGEAAAGPIASFFWVFLLAICFIIIWPLKHEVTIKLSFVLCFFSI